MSTLAQHVILKKNEDRRLLGGHQWIFSNEIHRIVGEPKSGEIVEILRSDGRSLGIGMFNPTSLIAVRFLSPAIETIDASFFQKKISAAVTLRMKLFPDSDTYRIVNGESDFLPGLIVDRYGDFLSLQTFSAGMESRLTMICDVLESIFHPKGIVERNESPLRSLEGLELRKGLLCGSVEPVTITLHDVKFSVDILGGQKSGFFLDQRNNRASIKPFTKNAAVLDCFCNEGGFGLYAAKFGASVVDSVDISGDAIVKAKQNAALNGLTTLQYHTEDVFTFLDRSVKEEKKWDVVILDPPSFTKSKKTVATAIKGYKEINTNGLRLVASNGIFVSASCSHHVDQDSFLNIVQESSVKANRRIQLLYFSGAAPDHPTLPSMPETHYLKFALCKVE
ncbi:MAG: class I SAM-dependent rRNA methyltransferase [Bacteriovoracaceae bacterium]|nr:class I SAM-dependent rRNA methyltransferase [Bacteroidota bacterium]